MKKIMVLPVSLAFLLTCFMQSLIAQTPQKQEAQPLKSCKSDSDCYPPPHIMVELEAPPPPCFRDKCQFPKSSEEYIELCEQRPEWGELCYERAAFRAVKKAPSSDAWKDAFTICDNKVPSDAEHCKLTSCQMLWMGGSNKENYDVQIKQCEKEAIKNSSCSDGKSNGWETDIDCGGPDCKPCKLNQKCKLARDCETQVCNNNGITNQTFTCIEKCPNGKIEKACHCYKNIWDKESADRWRAQYGKPNQPLYCCDNKLSQEPCK